MRQKQKLTMRILIILMAIGFAAVTTTIAINGTSWFSVSNDFDVIFTKAILDGVDVSEEVISEDGKTINYTTNILSVKGNKSVLEFEVTNNSTQYDADIEIENTTDNASEYYQITETIPGIITAQGVGNGSITIEVVKTSTETIEDELIFTIEAVAVEKSIASTEETCTYDYPTLITDENQNGEPDIGDMIGICNERFYVYKNDGEAISMLAEYNLEVGYRPSEENDYLGTSMYPPEVETFRQSPLAVGLKEGYETYATVSLDSTSGECNSYYYNSIPARYTDTYENYIESLGVPNIAFAISEEELEELGCSLEDSSCSNAPEWVYSTSYWTLSGANNYLKAVNANGNIDEGICDNMETYGVRPVIKIAKSLIGAQCSKPIVCEENICWQDTDCSSVMNLGDMVTLGSEAFYVYDINTTTISLLAEYNLYVGSSYTSDTGLVAYENPTGLQDSKMLGENTKNSINHGVTAFSDTSNVYEGSIVEGYVNTYSDYIKNTLSIENEASLITKEELELLGCAFGGTYCLMSPSWVSNTSYWTRTPYSTSDVYFISQTVYLNKLWNNKYYFSNNNYYGVRPVIKVSTDLFKNLS